LAKFNREQVTRIGVNIRGIAEPERADATIKGNGKAAMGESLPKLEIVLVNGQSEGPERFL
jgi:hypothetical protein